MISEESKHFIAEHMKIIVPSIEKKLLEPQVNDYIVHLEHLIKEFVQLARQGPEAGPKINDLADSSDIANKCAKEVLDSLRHAFASFAHGGLYDLYTMQEKEAWYPKILLTDVLEPNDIHTLPELVTIYRGCNIDEHESRNYGQAWTTSEDIAGRFAYEHYEGQQWFDRSKRVVLKTTYSRKNILFSCQQVEYEVVIIPSRLGTVEKHV